MRIGYLIFQGNPNATGGPLTVKMDDVSERTLFTLTEDEATELAQYLADKYLPPEDDNHHQGLRMLLVSKGVSKSFERVPGTGVDYPGFEEAVDMEMRQLGRHETTPLRGAQYLTGVYEVEVIQHVELSVKATVERKDMGNT